MKPEILVLLMLFCASMIVALLMYAIDYAEAWQGTILAECPDSGCTKLPYFMQGIVDPDAPDYGTKEWTRLCYNSYDNYQDRIRFC